MSPRWDVPGFFGGVLLCLEKDVGNHGEKPNLVQWFIVIVPFKMATTGVAHPYNTDTMGIQPMMILNELLLFFQGGSTTSWLENPL